MFFNAIILRLNVYYCLCFSVLVGEETAVSLKQMSSRLLQKIPSDVGKRKSTF